MSSVEHGAPGNVLLDMLSRGMYDQDTWERTAAILSEITNHSAKENTPQLEHANSGSLQRRGSSSIVSVPDGLDSSNKHMGRIPHSAYMCTDSKQHTHNHASAMQTSHTLHASAPESYHPQHTHQQAAPKAEARSSWSLHSAADGRAAPNKLAQQAQQAQQAKHNSARRSPQPNSRRLYNPHSKGAALVIEPAVEGDWPAHIVVQCNGNMGKFMLGKQSMVCMCKLCQAKAVKADLPYTEMTPTEFERHSGMQLLMYFIFSTA